MVFFSNAQGTNVQIVADPVNQGSVNANEVIFAGPFAPSNTVTVTYRTPGGISLTPRILSLVDGAQIIDGVEYNAWTGLLDAAVTEFAGTVTAMFSITASEGTTIFTNPAYFEVREGVYIEPPSDPSADVWGKILTALTTVKESVDNIRKDTDGNTADIATLESVVSSHSTQIASLSSNKLDKQTGETANHMVYAKTPDGAQEMLPFPSGTLANIKDGEPVGSLEQLSSEAQGEYDTAFGFNNVTSVKGYYIQKVRFTSDSTQLLIGDTQVNPIEVSTTELVPSSSFTAPLWDVGDEVCIVANYHYDFCAKITSIQNNLITLDKNLDGGYIGKVVAELNKEDNAIYVPTKPEAGIISLLHSAAVTGFDNKAVGKASFVSGAHNLAAGDYSHVEGRNNEAAYASHAEGWKTSARGEYAHTEGIGTSTTADCAHAEGQETKATKRAAHAEGYKTTASGELSHAEGYNTEASGYCSHTEGISTKASGTRSHAEGNETVASGDGSHAEGNKTKASGSNSHAEGGHDTTYTGEYGATASYTHVEGVDTLASAQGSHAEGFRSVASGQYSHAEGQSNATAWQSHAENTSTASGQQSHAEGAAIASGSRAHAENEAKAEGANSHAEGSADALAKGNYSHAEGGGKAYGTRSHAEGSGRTGQATGAAGAWEAHAEGAGTALGLQSHAEGGGTVASGAQSHAEGKGNTASGTASHAQGIGNTATADGQFVAGRYSKEGQNGVSSDQPDNELIVRIGAGQSAANRWTVFSIDKNGTTCMSSAGLKTDGIVSPWNVINKEYADAHYAPIGGGGSYASAVSSNTTTHILPKESTVILVGPSGAYATFDASSGMYKFTNYGTVYEMKASTFVTNGATNQHEYFFSPAYATTSGSTTTYYTPVYWYSEGTAAYCDADGTANANGAFVKVTSKMHYVVKS